jgi:sulfite reductase alpha subunit-like flavoprotein
LKIVAKTGRNETNKNTDSSDSIGKS